MKYFVNIILLALSLCSYKLYAQDNTEILRNIEKYTQKVQNEWKIPGLAISIVKDGNLIYTKGFGVKEIGGIEPINDRTVFQIGSVSKSFTATIIASLVDEGKLKWSDTVKNILPDFQMYDKWVEANMQVKDIMTHRSGLKGQAGTYIPNMGYDREDIYRMLPLIKPTYSFRGGYEYNNITFIIALKIIEKLTGKTWEQNIQERIFTPLGMSSSSVNAQGFTASNNVALPHEFYYSQTKNGNDSIVVNKLFGEEQALHWLTVIGPAGSVNSTVCDMSKYIQFHLDNGKINGQELVKKTNMDYIHKGQTITSQDSARTTLYGHCWFVEQNSRYRLYFHTGTTWGMTALCFFVPELNLGMMILANSEVPSSPRYAIMRRLIDLYKGSPDKDYSADFIKDWNESERKSFIETKEKESKKVKTNSPDQKSLVGIYDKGPLFGKAIISLENEELYITVGPKQWKNKLLHISGSEFSFRSDGHAFPIVFEMDSDQKRAISLDIDFGYAENFGKWIRQ